MSWYVLVEANAGADRSWELVRKVAVPGGREAAIAQGEEMSRTISAYHGDGRDGRLVFRTSPTSWLVEELSPHWYDGGPTTISRHMRLTVAELVMEREPVPAERPKWFGRRAGE